MLPKKQLTFIENMQRRNYSETPVYNVRIKFAFTFNGKTSLLKTLLYRKLHWPRCAIQTYLDGLACQISTGGKWIQKTAVH